MRPGQAAGFTAGSVPRDLPAGPGRERWSRRGPAAPFRGEALASHTPWRDRGLSAHPQTIAPCEGCITVTAMRGSRPGVVPAIGCGRPTWGRRIHGWRKGYRSYRAAGTGLFREIGMEVSTVLGEIRSDLINTWSDWPPFFIKRPNLKFKGSGLSSWAGMHLGGVFAASGLHNNIFNL